MSREELPPADHVGRRPGASFYRSMFSAPMPDAMK